MTDIPFPVEGERQGAARYLAAFREHWPLVAGVALVAVLAAAIYSFTAAKRYEASADLLVTPISATDETFLGIGLLREPNDPQSRTVLTAARLIKAPEVTEEVERRLDLDNALKSVDVRPLGQSNIVTIVGKAHSPERAAEIANTFAQVLIDQRTAQFQSDLSSVISRLERRRSAVEFGSIEAEQIEQRLAELRSLEGTPDPTLEIASSAVPPTAAVWPRPKLSIAVALLVGLLLGGGAALALELASPRVKREEELLLDHRLPILTRVPRLPARVVRGYLTRREPLPPEVWESYRTLRASLAAAGGDGGFPNTILVTSASPSEGKTMTSVNLAVTMALGGMRVLLVDGDLRRPMVAPVFGVAAAREGFAGLLLGKKPALVRAPGHGDRLRLLLASPEHAQLIDLLEPRRVRAALDQLRSQADVVIIDSPPLAEVADALPLADSVDAVLVATRLGHTRRDKLNDLRRMLAQHGVQPLGFIVTSRRRRRASQYYYAYHAAGEAAAPLPEGAQRETRARAAEASAATARAERAKEAEEELTKRRRALEQAERRSAEAAKELDARKGALQERERELEQHAAALGERETALQAREAELASRERELDAGRQTEQTDWADLTARLRERETALTARDGTLDKRERELAKREAEAEARRQRTEAEAAQAKQAAKEVAERGNALGKLERELRRREERVAAREAELARAQPAPAPAPEEAEAEDEPQAPGSRPGRLAGIKSLLTGAARPAEGELPFGGDGRNGTAFDLTIDLRLQGASPEAARQFADELAAYIEGLYPGQLVAEEVAVAGETAPFAVRLVLHAHGLTEETARSFGAELAAYVQQLYGASVAVADSHVSQCDKALEKVTPS